MGASAGPRTWSDSSSTDRSSRLPGIRSDTQKTHDLAPPRMANGAGVFSEAGAAINLAAKHCPSSLLQPLARIFQADASTPDDPLGASARHSSHGNSRMRSSTSANSETSKPNVSAGAQLPVQRLGRTIWPGQGL